MDISTIDIIVVNWNADRQLLNCVDSIFSFGGAVVRSVVVVDNASTDDSLDAISGNPKVELIRSQENLGFGKACNLGSLHGNAEYLLFLNPLQKFNQFFTYGH